MIFYSIEVTFIIIPGIADIFEKCWNIEHNYSVRFQLFLFPNLDYCASISLTREGLFVVVNGILLKVSVLSLTLCIWFYVQEMYTYNNIHLPLTFITLLIITISYSSIQSTWHPKEEIFICTTMHCVCHVTSDFCHRCLQVPIEILVHCKAYKMFNWGSLRKRFGQNLNWYYTTTMS